MTIKTKKRKRETKTGLVKKKRKINDNSIQENKITERNRWCSSVKYISPFMTSVSFEQMNTLRRKNKSYDSYLKRTTKNSWFSVIQTKFNGKNTYLDDFLQDHFIKKEKIEDDKLKSKYEKIEKKDKKPKKKTNLKGKSNRTKKTDKKIDRKQLIENKRKQIEAREKQSAGQSRKIRLYPNKDQRKTLADYSGTSRWTYNQCVRYWYECDKDKNLYEKLDHLDSNTLRTKFKNKNSTYLQKYDWVFKVPACVRDESILQFIVSKNQAQNKYEKMKEENTGNVKFPQFEFKSKKNKLQESFYVPHREYYHDAFEWMRQIKTKEKFMLKHDTRVIREPTGKYFILLPEPLKQEIVAPLSDNQRVKVASIDPGVRTFATIFDNNANAFEYGKGDIGRIFRIVYYMDKLQSKMQMKKGMDHTTTIINIDTI